MKPLIGLTAYPPNDTHGWQVPAAYIDAVAASGGIPLILPCVQPEFVETWLEQLHGVVLIGGGDIRPDWYGGQDTEHLYGVNDVRDRVEYRLVECLLYRFDQLPVFAICRGMQMLNTVLGGTLHTHLPAVYGETVLHRSRDAKPIEHTVRTVSGSLMAHLLGEETEIVSLHHQCVAKLGQGLRATAFAADGVIEAVEHDTRRHLLAVQWHPEMNCSRSPAQRALFDFFIEEACRYQKHNGI